MLTVARCTASFACESAVFLCGSSQFEPIHGLYRALAKTLLSKEMKHRSAVSGALAFSGALSAVGPSHTNPGERK